MSLYRNAQKGDGVQRKAVKYLLGSPEGHGVIYCTNVSKKKPV